MRLKGSKLMLTPCLADNMRTLNWWDESVIYPLVTFRQTKVTSKGSMCFATSPLLPCEVGQGNGLVTILSIPLSERYGGKSEKRMKIWRLSIILISIMYKPNRRLRLPWYWALRSLGILRSLLKPLHIRLLNFHSYLSILTPMLALRRLKWIICSVGAIKWWLSPERNLRLCHTEISLNCKYNFIYKEMNNVRCSSSVTSPPPLHRRVESPSGLFFILGLKRGSAW